MVLGDKHAGGGVIFSLKSILRKPLQRDKGDAISKLTFCFKNILKQLASHVN